MTLTLNRKRHETDELRVVWEWNPHYRGRRFWWLWERVTPYVLANAWVASRRFPTDDEYVAAAVKVVAKRRALLKNLAAR